MVKFSNKPNMKGIKNVAEDTNYKAKLVGREGRLFSAVMATRIPGIIYGLLLALSLVLLIPLLLKLLLGIDFI